jgi:hypothetical protein
MKDSWFDYSAKVVKQIQSVIDVYENLQIGGYYQLPGSPVTVYKITGKMPRNYSIYYKIYDGKGSFISSNHSSIYDTVNIMRQLIRVMPKINTA